MTTPATSLTQQLIHITTRLHVISGDEFAGDELQPQSDSGTPAREELQSKKTQCEHVLETMVCSSNAELLRLWA